MEVFIRIQTDTKFEKFYDLLLDLREDKRIKRAEEERDRMRDER